jgi:MarR family transcriptional regulator, lower aerobic nicotinate degradation pathway regulator
LKLLPGFLIRRAHQISAAILNEELGSLGITPSQFAVLTVIEQRPTAIR